MEPTPRPRFRWLRLTPDRAVLGLLALEGLLLLAERFGWFTFDRHKGYAPLVTIAAVGATLLLMLLWFLVALVFRRRFQFSLRSLMLLVVVVAIPCSWLATEMKAARQQQAAVQAIRELGGDVFYDYEPFLGIEHRRPPWPVEPWERVGPLGRDLLADVSWVNFYKNSNISNSDLECFEGLAHVKGVCLFNNKISDAGLENLKRLLPQLRVLGLSGCKVSDAGLAQLTGMTQLQNLGLDITTVSDAGLENLKGLIQIQRLSLDRTQVSDAGLEHLKGLTHLQWLSLERTQVGDAGLEHLKGLTEIQELYLGGTKISDAGLEHLKGLTHLQELHLGIRLVSFAELLNLEEFSKLRELYRSKTKVTDAGVRKLQRALPNTKIDR